MNSRSTPRTPARRASERGDIVRIASARGEIHLKAKVSDEVKPGIVYATFHFPGEVTVNLVTSSEADEDTLCPEYKVVAVDVSKVAVANTRETSSMEIPDWPWSVS